MQQAKRIGAAIILLFLYHAGSAQQLRLGNNPYTVEKSAVLELQSTNQGLLLPRIADTLLINALNPPDGMMIYFTPSKQLMLRVNGSWRAMTQGTAISSLNGLTAPAQTFATGTAGTDFNIASTGSTHTFNIPDASATARGLLTTGAQTIAGTKTFSSVPLFSSLTQGSVPFIGSAGLLSENNANLFWDATNTRLGVGTNAPASDLTLFQRGATATSRGFRFTGNAITGPNGGTGFSIVLGYNVANNKQLWLGDADYLGNANSTFIRYSASSGYTVLDAVNGDNTSRRPTAIGVGGDATSTVIFGSDGITTIPSSYVWANGNMAIGNGYRANAAPANGLLVQGNVGIGTTSPATRLHVAGTNPLTLNGVQPGTSTSADSLLTITNGLVRKLPVSTFATPITTGNLTETGSSILTITGGTGAVIGSGTTLQVKQANASQSGFLSNTDWTTFNNKLSTVDTTNISSFSTKVRSLFGAGTGLSYNAATGIFANTGVLSVNGNTGALTMDTGYIASFSVKARSLFGAGTGLGYNAATGIFTNTGVTSVNGNTGALTMDTGYIASFSTKVRGLFSAGTGITYNAATGVISASGAASTAWSLTGNAATSPSTNFLGTTDAQPLIIKTSNTQMGRFDANSLAFGLGANVNNATHSFAFGNNATTAFSITGALALGTSAAVNGSNAFAIGTSAVANGATSFALGNAATTAFGITDAMALGTNAAATASNGIAIGSNTNTAAKTTAAGASAVAIGTGAVSNTAHSIAIGTSSLVNFVSNPSIAIGRAATVNGAFSVAIGDSASATTVSNATVLGAKASVTASNSTAIGYNTDVTQSDAIILGDLTNSNLSVGIGSESFTSGAREKLLVDAGNSSSYNVISGKGNVNNYLQLNIQNRSNGGTASSDLVATADNGNESGNYVDLGINSSAFNNTTYPIIGGANNAYLYSTGNDFVIGNGTVNKNLFFFTGGYAAANERMRIDGSGNVGIGFTVPATPAAKLDVNGNYKLGAKGSVNKNEVSFASTISSTTVPAGVLTIVLPNAYTSNFVDITVNIPTANQLTSAQGTVVVSPAADLPSTVSIAFARLISNTQLKVRFLNTSTTATSVSGTFYFTVTEF